MTEQMVTGFLLGLWLGTVVGLVIGFLISTPHERAAKREQQQRQFLKLQDHEREELEGAFLRGGPFRGPNRS